MIGKPLKPLPLDFGLTNERIEQFNAGVPLKYHGLFILFVSLNIVFFMISKHESLGEILGITFSVILFGGLFFYPISNFLWIYIQKDKIRYGAYKVSLVQFELKYFQWLRTQLSFWQELSGRMFELHLAKSFKERGFEVEVIGGKNDGGIDLVLKKDNQKIAVQCKAHKKPIGPAIARELLGVLGHRKDFTEAWLVSTNGFTKATQIFIREKNIKLFSIEKLLSKEII